MNHKLHDRRLGRRIETFGDFPTCNGAVLVFLPLATKNKNHFDQLKMPSCRILTDLICYGYFIFRGPEIALESGLVFGLNRGVANCGPKFHALFRKSILQVKSNKRNFILAFFNDGYCRRPHAGRHIL
jgi:hypothetical protein